MAKFINVLRKIVMLILIVFIFIVLKPTSYINAAESDNRLFEFRGAWVATVTNVDIRKQSNSSPGAIDAYKRQFLNILNVFEEYNLNAVIFQVRPLNDAFYQSTINPWSRFLIGIEGTDPGWDPMAWMIEETHKRNMEFHAWMNPYRASLEAVSATGDYEQEKMNYLATLDEKNFAQRNPDLLIRGIHDKNSGKARLLLNPAREEVREHIYETISEVVRDYDVDAIHFDDYFYNGVADSEDNSDYEQYRLAGGNLSKDDWRREQVNILIKGIHELMLDLNDNLDKNVEFGISPAGVWAPSDQECNPYPGGYGLPGGMKGIHCYSYSSYVDLFADTRKWVNEEWIDYILPQNYGSFYDKNHSAITSWWANEVKNKDVSLYIGLAPYQYNSANQGWDIPDMEDQMNFGYSFDTVDGFAMYNISNLKTATNNNMRVALDNLKARWSEPVFLPMKEIKNVGDYTDPEVAISRSNFQTTLTFSPHEPAYAYAVYRTELGASFNPIDTPRLDIVYNRDNTISVEYPAERDKAYRFYIKTLYTDGNFGNEFITLTVDAYNDNSRPKILNLKLDTKLLVIEGGTFLNLSGELFDADGDRLTVTIRMNNRIIGDIKIYNVVDKFSRDIYIPDLSMGKSYFTVTVTDGITTALSKTFSFYVPARFYHPVMQYILTVDIITNEIVDRIYK